jgi:uncharacterized protein (DUF2141 family)
MRWRRIGPIAICWMLASPPAPAETNDAGTVVISGRIQGASGKHSIHVALWDANGFLREPAQKARIAAGGELRFQFALLPGRWTVSAFEDVNENGSLDMGIFGPKEPNGYWREFTGWHRPRFEEVANQVDRDVGDADIALK